MRFHEREWTGSYFPGHLRGDRVWVFALTEEVRAVPAAGARPGPNQFPATLVRSSERAQFVRLEFSAGVFADLPRSVFAAAKDNRDWLVEFPPAALRVI